MTVTGPVVGERGRLGHHREDDVGDHRPREAAGKGCQHDRDPDDGGVDAGGLRDPCANAHQLLVLTVEVELLLHGFLLSIWFRRRPR
jgi:hypothetical protein